MSPDERYIGHKPTGYERHMSVWWWLHKASYTWFVARELTSVFVAYVALLLILLLRALADGPEAYARLMVRLASPGLLAFDALALLAVVFHAVTWFNLAPTAMVVRVRGARVPGPVIAAANYAAWLVLSAAAAWTLTRG